METVDFDVPYQIHVQVSKYAKMVVIVLKTASMNRTIIATAAWDGLERIAQIRYVVAND